MMPWFIWNNKNSLRDFGLWINKLPQRMRGEERYEEIEVPGRAGSLIVRQGEDVYSSYTCEIIVIARNSLNMNRVADWLRGSSELIVSTDTERAIDASIVGEVSFARVGNWLMQATVPFLCEPFRHHVHPENDLIEIDDISTTIRNPGDVASKPVVNITVEGSTAKDVAVNIGGRTMIFEDVLGTIKVDCDAEMITQNNSIWQGTFSGKFLRIPTGESTFGYSGDAEITIAPNWRWF